MGLARKGGKEIGWVEGEEFRYSIIVWLIFGGFGVVLSWTEMFRF